MKIELPESKRIDIKKLGRLFDNMSESYKLFWFQAIVESVIKGKSILTYDDLINDMIASGWYMVSEYKLNLGPSDTMEKMILQAHENLGIKSSESHAKIIAALNNKNDPELLKMKIILSLNVPYRLQAPFLDDVKGSDWNKGPRKIAEQINGHEGLIYKFKDIKGLDTVIIIDDDFIDYIHENYEIVSGWIRYKMIEYLQKRNPSVPGVIYKIDPPHERKLEYVKRYWKRIIEHTEIRDIYSNSDLRNAPLSIDHFVPWSYVAHDELWNLIPTTKSINSSKSNNLPNWDKYVNKLCDLQYKAFQISCSNEDMKKLFNKCLDEHVNDANIRHTLYKIDQSKEEFSGILKNIIEPVYMAAKNLGFSEWNN